MSDFKDLLQGAGEAKRQLFASEDFAGDYGRTVVGRVKRRRAISATAMGGGTVVAAGVLAVGASNVPWGNFVMGASPSGSPSVVCTTSTPDAVAGFDASVPDGASLALVDNPSGEIVFLGAVNGFGAAWSSDGAVLPLEDATDPEGIAVLTLPSGRAVPYITKDGAGWVVPRRETNVTALTLDEYVGQPGSGVSVQAEDGTVLGRAIHTANGSLGIVAAGKFYPLAGSDGSTYSYVDGNGEYFRVTLVDNVQAAGISEPAATPVVRCATSSPEPSTSPIVSPSASPPVTPSISGVPTPLPTLSVAPASTPFQCGFEFSSDEAGTEAFRVGVALSNLHALRGALEEEHVPTEIGQFDVIPTPLHSVLHYEGRVDDLGVSDPAGGGASVGMSFVAVKDGVVVGTTVPAVTVNGSGTLLYRDTSGTANAFWWEPYTFTSCTSADHVTWDSIYAVAGVGTGDSTAYAWAKAPQA